MLENVQLHHPRQEALLGGFLCLLGSGRPADCKSVHLPLVWGDGVEALIYVTLICIQLYMQVSNLVGLFSAYTNLFLTQRKNEVTCEQKVVFIYIYHVTFFL